MRRSVDRFFEFLEFYEQFISAPQTATKNEKKVDEIGTFEEIFRVYET